MKHKKTVEAIVLLFLGVIINLVGKWLAVKLQLPLWMDAIGTCMTACLLGPIWGAVCGIANNLVYGFVNPHVLAYGLTSAAIGIIMGICMKKKMFSHIFTAMSASVIVAFASVVISTPLNLIFNKGMNGNVWGDAMYGMIMSSGDNRIIASILGELFVDFPDKVVAVLITYMLLRIPVFQKWLTEKAESKPEKRAIQNIKTLLFFCMIGISLLMTTVSVNAEGTNKKTNGGTAIQYTQTVYNSDNGLTAGEANAIVETPDGYIWIGTYAGLYRYDGHNFTLMNFDSVKNVNRLYVDKQGRLWIGTNDKGISIYENGTVTEVIDKNNGLPSNSIRCIGEDGAGNYYVGTSASLCILNDKDKLTVVKTCEEITYGNNISISEDGLIVVVTNAGELVFLKDQEIMGKYTLDQEGVYFTCSGFCADQSLRIATSSNEVYSWDFDKNEVDLESVIRTGGLSYIHSLYEDEIGRIWSCTDNGIGYFIGKQFYELSAENFNGSIDTMIKDYQGNLWFTSSRHGVLKLAQNSFQDIYRKCDLPNEVVNSITMWNGRMYSGTDSGLDIINLKTKAVTENDLTELLEDSRIRCVYVDTQNNLWIATSTGQGLLEVFPDGTISTYGTEQGTVGDRFRSVLELSDGTIVAAENTGIDFIKDGKVLSTLSIEEGLTNPQILSLLEIDADTLYAGSDGDGIMVIRDREVVDTITEEDGLPSGVILRMVKCKDGILIVTSNCLCYMDEKGQITELKEFPYANNYDVVSDGNGYLWVLGSAGIYIVNEDELLAGRCDTYELLDSRKGLQTSLTANSWNYVDQSELYLSCNTGVYSIDMKDYSVYHGSYKVMVDYVDSDNVNWALDENEVTKIPKDTMRIHIRPELLNYTLNDPYVSFYLEGFDEAESVVQQSNLTDLTYTNLPVGTYVFHLSVLDNTCSKVLETHTYTLEKEPQFWEHGWFVAYVILVCVLGVGYVTWLVAVLWTNQVIEKQKHEIELARKQAEMGNETILAIAQTVDAKDGNTSQHSARVAEYSVMLAKKLGWSEKDCENLRKIALLHDIGKIGIPDSILNKPGRLTDEEYEVMKSHVMIGSKILKDFTLVEHVADGVRYHHERYDGTGYAEGLKGEEIPLDGRIIGIADAYDAMTSNRVYRKRLDSETVLSELKKGRGTQFDPHLLDLFLQILEEEASQKEASQKEADENA